MSLISKALSINKGVQQCILNLNFYKSNYKFHLFSTNIRCKYETSVTLTSSVHRKYSNSVTLGKDKEIKKNNVSADGLESIYVGMLNKNIRNLKLLCLTTSIVGVAVQPLVFIKANAAHNVGSLTLPMFAGIALLALFTPPLLHHVTKRYVLEIHYNHKNDKYIATVYNFFCVRKKIEFTPNDITIPTILGMFTTCAIKGNPVFIDPKYFTDQQHFVKIMGYDKPLDLKLDTITHKETPTSKKNSE